jgi:predicted aspartyl protease
MPSFTTTQPTLLSEGPLTNIDIAVSFELEKVLKSTNTTIPNPVSGRALIDTGATISVISNNVIQNLGVNPIGTVLISTAGSSNPTFCYQYDLRIAFADSKGQVVVRILPAGVPLIARNIDCLIGRDVLRHSVFIYTGYANTFSLSF